MSDFLNWDLSQIPDRAPVDPQKALVTIKKAGIKTATNTGRLSLNLMWVIAEHPSALPVWQDLWMPREGDAPEKAEVMLTMLKDFFKGVQYDYSHITGIESLTEHAGELLDLQATASLGFEPADLENGYPAKNTIKALIPLS